MDSHLLPDDIVALAQRVVTENLALGRTVALAESCTGGLVAAAITEIAGSSAVLDRGFVTYSNESKRELLGVPEDIIDAFGAVSAACAWAMARGALKHSDADVAVAISGIAGPGGGSEMKPVGTVVFSRCLRGEEDHHGSADERLLDAASRSSVRHQATLCALDMPPRPLQPRFLFGLFLLSCHAHRIGPADTDAKTGEGGGPSFVEGLEHHTGHIAPINQEFNPL